MVVALLIGSGIRLYQSRWSRLPESTITASQPVQSEAGIEQSANEEIRKNEDTSVQHSSGKVNINEATKEALKKLPGIGDKTADQIIQYREANGVFSSTEDLMKIKGIGQKKYDQIKDKINI